MYSRELGGEALRFGVSGKLWHSVLVMVDRSTGSFWTQLDGRAIAGEETGARLEHVPSVFTTFDAWLEEHPDTLVLFKAEGERNQRASRYARYFADDALRFAHIEREMQDGELAPKTLVFGVRYADNALAVPEARLEREPVLNTNVGELPIALLRNAVTGEVRAVVRRIDGETRELAALASSEPTERIGVRGSVAAVQVADLEPLRVDRAYWFAWSRTVGSARLLSE